MKTILEAISSSVRIAMVNDVLGTKLEFFCSGLCTSWTSSKMKYLKYLKLDFEPYYCECKDFSHRDLDFVDLQFDPLIAGGDSFSNLEVLIIGGKSSLLLYLCLVYFSRCALWSLYIYKNTV